MSKKRDKKPSAPKGTLADQLKAIEKAEKLTRSAPAHKSPPAKKQAPEPKNEPAQKPASSPQDVPAPLSDEELFRLALNSVERGDLFRAKYEGQTDPLPLPVVDTSAKSAESETEPALDEESARQLVLEERARAEFARQVGSVIPIENKLHKASGRRRKDVHAATPAYSDEPARDLITPNLPRTEPGLSNPGPYVQSQREMLKRFQRAMIGREPLEINLRGDILADALRQLELFVHQAWKDQAGFVRVIHGRGLHSESGAIIKPAVLEWLEGPGLRYVRGYIPVLTASGDYGALIVELNSREPSDS